MKPQVQRQTDILAQELVHTVMRGDEDSALRILERLIASGLDGRTIFLDVFQPALYQMGDLWEAGKANVAQEHFAASVVRWLMGALWDLFTPSRIRMEYGPLLCACVPNERHDIGIAMVSELLRQDGWYVINLGADTPSEAIATMAVQSQSRVCLLSASSKERLNDLEATIDELKAATPNTPILVGGLAFRREPSLAADVGASSTASDADGAVNQVRTLLGSH